MFTGLALVVIGTGFFKSNVSTMVGQLYRPNDPRRTPGFSIYYMGINLGAFVAPLVCGWLQVFAGARFGASLGWRLGFMAAGIGMVAGLTQYLLAHRSHLAGIGDPPSAHKETDRSHEPLTPTERTRIGAIVVFSFVVIFFFAAFEQSSTSMAFFAAEHTDRAVPRSLAWLVGGSDTFPAAWFQSVNPLLILALAPLFARLWPALRRRSSEPSAPGKMGVGLILLGLGFVFMIAAGALSDRAHLAPPWLLVAMLFIHTLSELCISPVGLALVTELAPRKYAAMLMGVWFIGAFVGNFIAGKAAGQVDWFSAHTGPLGGLQGYYTIFTAGPILAGLGLLMASKRVNRWMAIEP
jgi:POT family proton-dependent oligopeptide transporter